MEGHNQRIAQRERRLAACGRKGKCNQITRCNAEGACHYTGTPFTQPARVPREQDQVTAADVLTHKETVDHPAHYGGANNPYEVIKVIYAWGLDKSFNLGNAIKYIARHEQKGAALEDLKKARWYLDEQIKQMEKLT